MTPFPLFKSSDYFISSLRNWYICLWNTNSSPGFSQIVPLAPVYFRFRNHFHFCRIIFPFSDRSYHFVRCVHLFRHNKICGSHYSLVRFPVRQISAFTMQRVNICQWHTHTTHPLPSPSSSPSSRSTANRFSQRRLLVPLRFARFLPPSDERTHIDINSTPLWYWFDARAIRHTDLCRRHRIVK